MADGKPKKTVKVAFNLGFEEGTVTQERALEIVETFMMKGLGDNFHDSPYEDIGTVDVSSFWLDGEAEL
jgi:hypothetical protein